MPKAIQQNILFYGDNLPILREHIADESVDLIYLDPPFNSQRTYNVLFKHESGDESEAQIAAFEDTWHWPPAAKTYHELLTTAPERVSRMMEALHDFIGPSQMLAYLVMMAARLVELHRVLKPTGSLYLHCDPTASHYLKVMLDAIFGVRFFQNEIVWKRTSSHGDAGRFPNITDTIFFYTKSSVFVWNKPSMPHDEGYIRSHYTQVDNSGRRFRYDNLVKPKGSIGYFYTLLECPPPPNGWRMPEARAEEWLKSGRIEIPPRGKIPAYIRYLDEVQGTAVPNLWTDISPINSQAREALGYPTQKPLALLERIIQASSNPGDIVLDPFCGCGTAIAAAQKLGRRWVGIDITYLAIALQKYRLQDMFPGATFKVIGEPQDIRDAWQLAQDDRFQFQWWALSLVKARPAGGQEGGKQGKKGADKGIDGIITFIDDMTEKPRRIIVQVKSGKVSSRDIRDLVGAVNREKAVIGLFITLEEPTQPMLIEAAAAGFYRSPGWHQDYPKIQILTIKQLLSGVGVDMPPTGKTFKQAQRVKEDKPDQPTLFED